MGRLRHLLSVTVLQLRLVAVALVLLSGCATATKGTTTRPPMSKSPGATVVAAGSPVDLTVFGQALLDSSSANTLSVPSGSGDACTMSRPARDSLFVGGDCPTLTIAGATAIEGASAALNLGRQHGSLHVYLSHQAAPTADMWRYRAERIGRCHFDGGLWVCATLWRTHGRLPVDAVRIDALLQSASADFTLHGATLSLTWRAVGELNTSAGPHTGFLLLQQQGSDVRGTWGGVSVRTPSHLGNIYRRFEPT